MRRSLHAFSLLPAVLPALLIAGCAGTQNRGLESVHQPVVARQDYPYALQTAGDRLAPGEAARLRGWLDAMRLRYGDKIALDDPYNGRGVRIDVARVVADYGLLLDTAPPMTADAQPGGVRVVVSRMQASVPGCPDWSRDSSVDYSQNTSSNFGCATNASLAAMVAAPEDLVHGRDDASLDVTRSGKAIEALRKAVPSGGGGTNVSGGAK